MNPSPPPLLLAPMEGLLDFVLRDILNDQHHISAWVQEGLTEAG